MSAVRFLLFAAIGTLLSWATWTIVILRIDPVSGGIVAKALFMTSLWLALTGTGTVIGFLGRYLFMRQGLVYRHLGVASRQSVIVATTIVFGLILQAARSLTFVTGGLVVVIALSIEIFILAGQSRVRPELSEASHVR